MVVRCSGAVLCHWFVVSLVCGATGAWCHWCVVSLVRGVTGDWCSVTGAWCHWCVVLLVCGVTGVWCHWCVVSLVRGVTGVWCYWCVVSLVCGVTGVWFYWCMLTLLCGVVMWFRDCVGVWLMVNDGRSQNASKSVAAETPLGELAVLPIPPAGWRDREVRVGRERK